MTNIISIKQYMNLIKNSIFYKFPNYLYIKILEKAQIQLMKSPKLTSD